MTDAEKALIEAALVTAQAEIEAAETECVVQDKVRTGAGYKRAEAKWRQADEKVSASMRPLTVAAIQVMIERSDAALGKDANPWL